MIQSLGSHCPSIDSTAFVAENATLVGKVSVGPGASVWYGAVLRADLAAIQVGAGSNIQDNCVLHLDEGMPCLVGEGVTVGHGAILHGCTIEDNCLIGMGAILLNGAVIGRDSMVGAGALITQNTVIPAGSLVLGSPAKVMFHNDILCFRRRSRNAAPPRSTGRWPLSTRSGSSSHPSEGIRLFSKICNKGADDGQPPPVMQFVRKSLVVLSETGIHQFYQAFHSLLLVGTVRDDADGDPPDNTQGEYAQKALSVDSALLFLHPDGGLVLVGFLDEKSSGTSVQTDLILNKNFFHKHGSYSPIHVMFGTYCICTAVFFADRANPRQNLH